MLFNSLEFLIFFPLAVAIYYATPTRWRILVLLIESYLFYSFWYPPYAGFLAALTLIHYFSAIQIDRSQSSRRRRAFLALSMTADLGSLIGFKWTHGIIVPVGISFHVLQTLGYSIDVYKGRIQAERNLLRFALFVCFFPQLMAGPIERAKNLMPQLHRLSAFDSRRFVSGLKAMLFGFAMKCVIADRLGAYVDAVYSNLNDASASQLLTSMYFFPVQIYCDFAGYSLIAIGAAQVMGFELMRNFDRPYQAQTLSDYWRRWHISLYSWFKDYVYLPLGGHTGSKILWARNTLTVFALSGLWHGSKISFLIWGLYHGVGLILQRVLPFLRSRLVTFHWIALGFILFRSQSISETRIVIEKILNGAQGAANSIPEIKSFNQSQSWVALAAILLLVLYEEGVLTQLKKPWLAWPGAIAATLLILWFGYFDQTQFIYFAF